MTVEHLLRETFTAHEHLSPDPAQVLRDITRNIQDDRHHGTRRLAGRHRRTAVLASASAAAVVAIAVIASVLAANVDRRPHASPGANDSATGPLLSYLPPPTGPVAIARGVAAGRHWTLWAQMTAVTRIPRNVVTTPPGANTPVSLLSGFGLATQLTFSPVNDTAVAVGGFSGPVGDPRQLPRIALAAGGPGTGFDAKVIIGVTAAPAESIRIELAGHDQPVTVTVGSSAELPDLRFFVAQVPLGHIDSITALDGTGKITATAEAKFLPQGP